MTVRGALDEFERSALDKVIASFDSPKAPTADSARNVKLSQLKVYTE